jgi:acetyl-CoA decarbonylase/synthase complex subunit gamma
VRSVSKRPLILIGSDAGVLEAGLKALEGENALIYAADESNWEALAQLAKDNSASLAVKGDTLEAIGDLTAKIKEDGLADLVIAPGGKNFNTTLVQNTLIRRLALVKNFRPMGFPIITFPGEVSDPNLEVALAGQAISKYAGFVVMDTFKPETIYALLVLRENIYTDPQKPIQVQPGLYEINNPSPDDPVLVTTNFSITYFSVANEIEGGGIPAWLLVADAEGMSVLTAWAAGNFDAEQIGKDVKKFEVADKVSKKRIVIPGSVAVISGELEEELPDWEIKVGPREAVDIPAYVKNAL